MKKNQISLPLALGLILYGVALVTGRNEIGPPALHYVILAAALVLELWGIILMARSPAMQNSRLRQLKLRLIGKGKQ